MQLLKIRCLIDSLNKFVFFRSVTTVSPSQRGNPSLLHAFYNESEFGSEMNVSGIRPLTRDDALSLTQKFIHSVSSWTSSFVYLLIPFSSVCAHNFPVLVARRAISDVPSNCPVANGFVTYLKILQITRSFLFVFDTCTAPIDQCSLISIHNVPMVATKT